MSSILNLNQRFTFQIASPSRLRVKIIIPLYVHKSTYFLYKIAFGFNHKIIVIHKLLTYQKESFFETCSTMLTVYLIEYLPVICLHLSF